MTTTVQNVATTCQVCSHLCPRGAAEYHPHEFCRIYKAGGNPWRGRKPLTIHEMTPDVKAKLQERCRRFWRSYYSAEVTLP